ncbi:MAG TPA: serine/threonine-protein kinase [Sedimentisphaerales bacterium]|jgi:serine/threonine-protein kinase|nr:serine/threonine-protein kinase [Sedimentisphaerales bacterium]HNU31041.1 serine/threonine-protein kinase [Sedimentisphaerales bacterium]
MSTDPNNPNQRESDEAEFEASLVSDTEADLLGAQTEIVEAEAVSPKPHPASSQPRWAGKVLGHFRLVRLIGEGNMGRVIQAQDINLHRTVALKVLCKRLSGVDDKRHVEQFLREARAAAQIDHPNVVQVYEINQHDGWWYIAMELLDAGNLSQVIKAAGPLSAPRACSLIADAAIGLAAAHQLGIIHRDVKPANLMLTRQGRCKVTDFGLVRLDDPNDPFRFTRKAVGSPAFMAPEVIVNREQTPAIDVYSLGATLFYALTGKAPYSARSMKELLQKHVHEAIPDVRASVPECPASLAALVTRTLAKKAADRPSAADLATALRAEAITTQWEDSGALGTAGTSLLQTLLASRAGAAASSRAWGKLRSVVATRPRGLLTVAVVLAIVAGAALLGLYSAGLWPRASVHPHPARLAELFPNAPRSYGVLPPATVPQPIRVDSEAPPAFSWVHSIEPGSFQFVATKSGRRFYPADSAEAILIPLRDFVGYKTIEQARADGKVPAP